MIHPESTTRCASWLVRVFDGRQSRRILIPSGSLLTGQRQSRRAFDAEYSTKTYACSPTGLIRLQVPAQPCTLLYPVANPPGPAHGLICLFPAETLETFACHAPLLHDSIWKVVAPSEPGWCVQLHNGTIAHFVCLHILVPMYRCKRKHHVHVINTCHLATPGAHVTASCQLPGLLVSVCPDARRLSWIVRWYLRRRQPLP